MPSIFTFWIPGYFYPLFHISLHNKDLLKDQHQFMLAVMLWLITIGPRRSWIKDLMWIFQLCLPLKQIQSLVKEALKFPPGRVMLPIEAYLDDLLQEKVAKTAINDAENLKQDNLEQKKE